MRLQLRTLKLAAPSLSHSRLSADHMHGRADAYDSNHLDLETIDVLIRAINEWKGCVMIVSHDQHYELLQGCLVIN
jgi:hypothetical protein